MKGGQKQVVLCNVDATGCPLTSASAKRGAEWKGVQTGKKGWSQHKRPQQSIQLKKKGIRTKPGRGRESATKRGEGPCGGDDPPVDRT